MAIYDQGWLESQIIGLADFFPQIQDILLSLSEFKISDHEEF